MKIQCIYDYLFFDLQQKNNNNFVKTLVMRKNALFFYRRF